VQIADSKKEALLVKITSTFFYIGYLPFIPGTFASLAGLFIFILIRDCIFTQLVFFFCFLALGFLTSGRAEQLLNQKDPKFIVIDEVAGVFLCLLFLPYDFRVVLIGFFLFRILDTLKPFPAERIQRIHGSLGIMGDDIIAGLYTNAILQVVFRIFIKI
jgi:phosphatidylglycerophosphatase A